MSFLSLCCFHSINNNFLSLTDFCRFSILADFCMQHSTIFSLNPLITSSYPLTSHSSCLYSPLPMLYYTYLISYFLPFSSLYQRHLFLSLQLLLSVKNKQECSLFDLYSCHLSHCIFISSLYFFFLCVGKLFREGIILKKCFIFFFFPICDSGFAQYSL